MELRPCTKCKKVGYWYALCPECRAKIDADYKKMTKQKKK